MEVSSMGSREFEFPCKHQDMREREESPERSKVVCKPVQRRVAVVYYLCRDGHLEHPHFIEVPLPSDSTTHGLYLRDVVNRLNVLRGKGMASMYSWSSKRTYKNGYVWHDLAENDFIYPSHGNEYVLKGSEILDRSLSFRIQETGSSSSSSTAGKLPEPKKKREEGRNQSWSSIDLHEYRVVHKPTESTDESFGKAAADASTQTDDESQRRRRKVLLKQQRQQMDVAAADDREVVLKSEEISPPPLSPSPEMGGDRKKESSVSFCSDIRDQTAKNHHPSGRSKASAVLMQLISCGSVGSSSVNENHEHHVSLSLPSRASKKAVEEKEKQKQKQKGGSRFGGIRVEDKEYFSGSLIMEMEETKGLPALKRSSSYNADRCSKFETDDNESKGGQVISRCIPRRSIKNEDNSGDLIRGKE